jgi:heme-degrading monooxygenase HmoA
MNRADPTWGYLVIWEFRVRTGQQEKFEEVYGPAGHWAELFRKTGDYVGTELVRDLQRPGRYITLDYWTTSEAYQQFRSEHDQAYASLDAACEQLTESESAIGEFGRTSRCEER